MHRRTFLASAATGTAAAAAASLPAAAQDTGRTGFVLVHGSWHGAWCWGLVEPYLNAMGHVTVPVDLPGHGLNALIPASFTARPLDPAAFASEPSPLAEIPIDAYADAVIAGAERARQQGAERVFAVGHSMGGVPVSFAAAKAPEAFAGLVYLAAVAPTPGKPGGAYLALEAQANESLLGPIVAADPAVVGALRIDPRSTDPDYLAAAKAALAADVPDDLLATVMHMLTPDAPITMYGDVAEFAAGAEALERSYIICTEDRTVVRATSEAIIADMTAAWPEKPTRMLELASSHEAMFSVPEALAEAIATAV
ncbi:MAG: alpha/beta fold hydrolase [Pseudomonadota bacterium]